MLEVKCTELLQNRYKSQKWTTETKACLKKQKTSHYIQKDISIVQDAMCSPSSLNQTIAGSISKLVLS